MQILFYVLMSLFNGERTDNFYKIFLDIQDQQIDSGSLLSVLIILRSNGKKKTQHFWGKKESHKDLNEFTLVYARNDIKGS